MKMRNVRGMLLLAFSFCALAQPGSAGEIATRQFNLPQPQQLSLAESVLVRMFLPPDFVADSVRVELDDIDVTTGLTITAREHRQGHLLIGTLTNVPVGQHRLHGFVTVLREGEEVPFEALTTFETIALENPDECDVLNNAECFLPYPSSRFLEPADTPTGFRLRFPASGMPMQNNARLLPDPYSVLDGFSPTVQVLMHFPGNVDLVHSGAAQLLESTRSIGLRSLDCCSARLKPCRSSRPTSAPASPIRSKRRCCSV